MGHDVTDCVGKTVLIRQYEHLESTVYEAFVEKLSPSKKYVQLRPANNINGDAVWSLSSMVIVQEVLS